MKTGRRKKRKKEEERNILEKTPKKLKQNLENN